MLNVKNILAEYLSKVVKEIKSNTNGTPANSVKFEVSGNTIVKGEITGVFWIEVMEIGQKPRIPNGLKRPPLQPLIRYFERLGFDNPLFAALRKREQISTVGSNLWLEKGSKGQRNNIFTNEVNKAKNEFPDIFKDVIIRAIKAEFFPTTGTSLAKWEFKLG